MVPPALGAPALPFPLKLNHVYQVLHVIWGGALWTLGGQIDVVYLSICYLAILMSFRKWMQKILILNFAQHSGLQMFSHIYLSSYLSVILNLIFMITPHTNVCLFFSIAKNGFSFVFYQMISADAGIFANCLSLVRNAPLSPCCSVGPLYLPGVLISC